jgi:site-specific DNA-methyltransferase (adenine-specific)
MHHADAVAWAKTYDGPPYHALFADAPYEIGFMSKGWDASGVAFDPETWKAFTRILHPGAYLFVFAGTLNDDLISLALRQAGLRKHHKAMSYCYGSGFPKATRIDTQIDKRAGNPGNRKIAANASRQRGMDFHMTAGGQAIYTSTTPLAQTWQSHRYGQQALKPALEPILIFQKPYEGNPVDCMTTTGAGALSIDGARIGSENTIRTNGTTAIWSKDGNRNNEQGGSEAGRWPANLLLTHDPRCNGHCVPECPIERLGQQSGKRVAGGGKDCVGQQHGYMDIRQSRRNQVYESYNDIGTASRFFHQSDWMLERLELQDSLIYSPKAGRSEREAGLDPLQTALMRQLYGIEDESDFDETTVDDGRQKPIDNPYLRGETTRRNTHPTIKPLSLCRYLATLLLPPDAYASRRLLIPFAGAASEMVGALLAGWEHVDGIELDSTHVKIARARLAYWQQMRHKFSDGQPIKVQVSRQSESGQASLFDAA